MHDYDFLLLEADYVDPEAYKTDLRQFFEAMQSRQDREKLRSLLRSENFMNLCPETEQAIAAHLHVKRLLHKIKKEGLPMCKAFDDLMKEERRSGIQEGIQKGIKKGMQEGIQKGEKTGKRKEKFSIIRKMHEKGMDGKLIRELTGCTKKELAAAVGR